MNVQLKKIPALWWLLLGIASFSITHMSFSVGLAAWVSNVPFLLYLSLSKGWKEGIWFALALITAWSLAILKIVSPPMPYLMVFLFALPISLFHLPAYWVWSRYQAHKWSVLLFPAVFAVMEWAQYTFTTFGSWGVMAYTQAESLPVMQGAAVFGLAGLSFLIYWVNAATARLLLTGKATLLSFTLPAVVLALVVMYGDLRIDAGRSKGVETITAAAIGTDSEVSGLPLPSAERNAQVVSDIFERTKKAAAFGAQVAVWTEGAFYTLPAEEAALIDSMECLARAHRIAIFAAYIVPISEQPFQYENKYVFVSKAGKAAYTYLKHEPVPGEPAVRGRQALQTVEVAGSRMGGAICYDYAFPYIARAFGHLKADIVALPASDWRGIDPLHTRMAAFRAVEQGHAIIRSTRFGLSAVVSPYGELLGQASSFDDNNKVLVSSVPGARVKTVYSVIGDAFVFVCMGFLVVFFKGQHFL